MGFDEIEQIINSTVFARLEEQRPRAPHTNHRSIYLQVQEEDIRPVIEPEVKALLKERSGCLHARNVTTKYSGVLTEF